jgi:hypothetical protein
VSKRNTVRYFRERILSEERCPTRPAIRNPKRTGAIIAGAWKLKADMKTANNVGLRRLLGEGFLVSFITRCDNKGRAA